MLGADSGWLSIESVRALRSVAGRSDRERREFRRRLGGLRGLSELDADSANFFYGECLVFDVVSDDIKEWMSEHFHGKGGAPGNQLRMRELFQFYQALTADVDIRYGVSVSEDGGFTVTDASINAVPLWD